MSEHPIRIKSVNVHRNTERTHGMLQTDADAFDVILIQEPWFSSVATLRSDTDPNGTPQTGFTFNNKWLTLAPPYSSHEHPKVCAYINKQTILQTSVVNHIPPSPLISSSSMVIDLLTPANTIALRLVNVYHDRPTSGHSLTHIFSQPLDENCPTLFLGDFNTHSHRWSLPHSTPSSWAHSFHDWMDDNGLEVLNPVNKHTWQQPGSRPSIIDLALANESARFFANLSALSISWTQAISDHAALLIEFYPESDISPPRHDPTGFHIDPTKKEAWITSLRSLVQHTNPISTDPLTAPSDFHAAIITACKTHFEKLKSGPPKGVVWWNDDCSSNFHILRTSRAGHDRKLASKSFRQTVREAKRSWAHQQLFETQKTNNIWNMARVRKGRRPQALPPLKDNDDHLHSNTATKASLLKDRFFPAKSNTVNIAVAAAQDPPALPTRPWVPIEIDEIAEALKDTSNKSAPGPSGINYQILKWAFEACPEELTRIYNLSLSTGIHAWKHATIVPVPKPNKPDYSAPKAYRPVSLMECTGKLLEKVIARRIANDIALYPDILPNNQFGSRPQHCTTDAALALVHRIQATRNSGHHGALILFDISGFFDHIDATRTCDIFFKKGFPTNMTKWVFSFLTDRTASMRIDSVNTDPFSVPDGTPQGSPLSPILSAIYTSFLLTRSFHWSHAALSLYVDDGAIFTVSATPNAAAHTAISKLEETLEWLNTNGLTADFDKTELMIFSPPRYRGPTTKDTAYSDPTGSRHRLTPTTRIRYLGFFLTPTLDWHPHISIMAMRARSTIRGLSILGNSIRGLDLVHWKQVYLMYVIPILTYGVPVWYTGKSQKGLIDTLQRAQNEGIRKITGVFRTTPTAISENMIGIPPIKYLLPRIIHSFRNRLIATNPNHILHSILTTDQCAYWRITPTTTLTSLLHDLETSTFTLTPLSPWKPSNVSFSSSPKPYPLTTALYYVPSHADESHLIHVVSRTHSTYSLLRTFTGTDHIQALGLAIESSLQTLPSLTHHFIHTPSFENKLTSPKPHRDSSHFARIRNIIDNSPSVTTHLYLYATTAKDSPNPTQRRFWNSRFSASPRPTHSPSLSPRELMWKNIKEDYVPFNHPSAIACQIPDNGQPVAAIRGALKSHSRVVTSSIIRIATGHCFDANYSQRFRPQSNDPLTCPHPHPHHPHLHTRHHIIFQCAQYAKERRRFIPRPWRLSAILQSEDASEGLGLFLKASNCSILRPIPTPTLPSPTLSLNATLHNPLNPEPP